MRLIFAGTPAFAAVALEALIAAGHEIVLVLTQPDRPAGRGMKLIASEVKQVAQRHGLPVYQPVSLRDAQARERLSQCDAEAMIVAAYGLILPKDVLNLFPNGCINIHASLLPRWRGAAPIQHALLAGDKETGICIMQMDEGLDTGPVYLRAAIGIEPRETARSLHDKLADLGGRKIVEALEAITGGRLHAQPQTETGATYAHKITREQARIDWSQPVAVIERHVRAFDPFPGAFSHIDDQTIKIWSAIVRTGNTNRPVTDQPGVITEVSDEGIVVSCSDGELCLLELQRAGGKRLSVGDFLRGFPLAPGRRFAD